MFFLCSFSGNKKQIYRLFDNNFCIINTADWKLESHSWYYFQLNLYLSSGSSLIYRNQKYIVDCFCEQVATQFKSSLAGLTEILMTKEPWYVRCLKPNHCKQPGEPFTSHLLLVVLSAECFTRRCQWPLSHSPNLRSLWWCHGETSSQVPGVNGAPESQACWVCL